MGEKSSTNKARFSDASNASISSAFSAQHQAADGDGPLKYVVLYAFTLLLQPQLTAVLTLAALWGLWQVVLWLFLS